MTWLDDYLLRQQVVVAGFTLDVSSAALQVGDWFCVAQGDTTGGTVTKATTAALAAAGAPMAIAVESAQPGQPVRGIPLGLVPRNISGLGAGTAGVCSIDANARTQRGAGPYSIGFCDTNGTLTVRHLLAVTTVTGTTAFNVQSYGAVGDGITDDTAAIAAAIAAAVAAKGIVYFPPGTYLTDAIAITGATGVRLLGAGHRASIIKARGVGNIVTFSGCTACGFERLAIERGNSLFGSGGPSLAFQAGCVNCWTEEIRLSYASSGILVQRCTNTHLRGRTIVDHLSAGGGAAAVRFVGEAGVGDSDGLEIDWLVYDYLFGTRSFNLATGNTRKTWAASTAFAVGDIISTDDRFWECVTAGVSAASGTGPSAIPGTDGPSAYATDVVDGTVHWRFLVGNCFALDIDYDARDVHVGRFDCYGPCSNAVVLRNTGGGSPSVVVLDEVTTVRTLATAINLSVGSVVQLTPYLDTCYQSQGISVGVGFTSDLEIRGGLIRNIWSQAVIFTSGSRCTMRGTKILDASRSGAGGSDAVLIQPATTGVHLDGVIVSSANSPSAVNINGGATNVHVTNCQLAAQTNGISNSAGNNATLQGNRGMGEEYRPPSPGAKFGGFLADANSTLDNAEHWVSYTATAGRTYTLGTASVINGDKRVIENRSNQTHTEGATATSIPAGYRYLFKRSAGAWSFDSRELLS